MKKQLLEGLRSTVGRIDAIMCEASSNCLRPKIPYPTLATIDLATFPRAWGRGYNRLCSVNDDSYLYMYSGSKVIEGATLYYATVSEGSPPQWFKSPARLYEYKHEIFYCAFSCLGYGPYICCSNVANCKFTLGDRASYRTGAVQK